MSSEIVTEQRQDQPQDPKKRQTLKILGITAGLVGTVGSAAVGLYELIQALDAASNKQQQKEAQQWVALLSRFKEAQIQPVQIEIGDNWTPNSAHVTVTQPNDINIGNVSVTIVTDKQYIPPSSYEAQNFAEVAYFTDSDGNRVQSQYTDNSFYFLDGQPVQVAPLSKVAPQGKFSEKDANLAVLQTNMGGVFAGDGLLTKLQAEGFSLYVAREPSNQITTDLNIKREIMPLSAYTLLVPTEPAMPTSTPTPYRRLVPTPTPSIKIG